MENVQTTDSKYAQHLGQFPILGEYLAEGKMEDALKYIETFETGQEKIHALKLYITYQGSQFVEENLARVRQNESLRATPNIHKLFLAALNTCLRAENTKAAIAIFHQNMNHAPYSIHRKNQELMKAHVKESLQSESLAFEDLLALTKIRNSEILSLVQNFIFPTIPKLFPDITKFTFNLYTNPFANWEELYTNKEHSIKLALSLMETYVNINKMDLASDVAQHFVLHLIDIQDFALASEFIKNCVSIYNHNLAEPPSYRLLEDTQQSRFKVNQAKRKLRSNFLNYIFRKAFEVASESIQGKPVEVSFDDWITIASTSIEDFREHIQSQKERFGEKLLLEEDVIALHLYQSICECLRENIRPVALQDDTLRLEQAIVTENHQEFASLRELQTDSFQLQRDPLHQFLLSAFVYRLIQENVHPKEIEKKLYETSRELVPTEPREVYKAESFTYVPESRSWIVTGNRFVKEETHIYHPFQNALQAENLLRKYAATRFVEDFKELLSKKHLEEDDIKWLKLNLSMQRLALEDWQLKEIREYVTEHYRSLKERFESRDFWFEGQSFWNVFMSKLECAHGSQHQKKVYWDWKRQIEQNAS